MVLFGTAIVLILRGLCTFEEQRNYLGVEELPGSDDNGTNFVRGDPPKYNSGKQRFLIAVIADRSLENLQRVSDNKHLEECRSTYIRGSPAEPIRETSVFTSSCTTKRTIGY